jgi:hypothetical protein
MAYTSDDRWGSFWVWATIVIVLLSIVVAWLSAHNRVDDDIPARAPAATGAVGQQPIGASGRVSIAVGLPGSAAATRI